MNQSTVVVKANSHSSPFENTPPLIITGLDALSIRGLAKRPGNVSVKGVFNSLSKSMAEEHWDNTPEICDEFETVISNARAKFFDPTRTLSEQRMAGRVIFNDIQAQLNERGLIMEIS